MISIDGTRGAGKTSQIGILARHFRSMGVNVLSLNSGGGIKTEIETLSKAEEFLTSEPNGIVILDGSIARPIVMDIIAGMSNPTILEKYKELTHIYERLDHKYGIACFLMVMDDMEECNRRIKRKKELTGSGGLEIENLVEEGSIVSALRLFNNHITSKNIHFQTIVFEKTNPMLEINKTLILKLAEKYEFPSQKKDANDW